MIYSVYDYDTKLYRYFEAARSGGTHADAPPRPLAGGSPKGVAPESATWRLPFGARPVGTGPFPRGSVASTASPLSGFDDLSTPFRVGAVLGLAYLAWKVIK